LGVNLPELLHNWARDHARRRSIRPLDRQRTDNELDTPCGKGLKIGELFGNQDSISQQRAMHRKREIRRAAVERKIRSRCVDSEELNTPLSKAACGLDREAWVVIPAWTPPLLAPTRVDGNDVGSTQ